MDITEFNPEISSQHYVSELLYLYYTHFSITIQRYEKFFKLPNVFVFFLKKTFWIVLAVIFYNNNLNAKGFHRIYGHTQSHFPHIPLLPIEPKLLSKMFFMCLVIHV